MRIAPPPRNNWIGPIPKGHGSALVRLWRPQPFEVSYLSWGRRHYGEPRIEPTTHEGWHYFLVLAGRPSLVVNGKEIATESGSISIGHPNCMIGHEDQPGRVCEMLTWVWRTEPTHSSLRPEEGAFLLMNLEPDQVRRLKQLHFQSRDAVADASERSMLQLRAARLFIDLCLLETRERQAGAEDNLRFDMAVQYLRSHLGEKYAIRGVCEYLQISKASLYRLFQDRVGTGPRAFSQDLRMQWAREQLHALKQSVKSVAYALGYLHSPDFSRAFKRHFGITASRAERYRNGGKAHRRILLPVAR